MKNCKKYQVMNNEFLNYKENNIFMNYLLRNYEL